MRNVGLWLLVGFALSVERRIKKNNPKKNKKKGKGWEERVCYCINNTMLLEFRIASKNNPLSKNDRCILDE